MPSSKYYSPTSIRYSSWLFVLSLATLQALHFPQTFPSDFSTRFDLEPLNVLGHFTEYSTIRNTYTSGIALGSRGRDAPPPSKPPPSSTTSNPWIHGCPSDGTRLRNTPCYEILRITSTYGLPITEYCVRRGLLPTTGYRPRPRGPCTRVHVRLRKPKTKS